MGLTVASFDPRFQSAETIVQSAADAVVHLMKVRKSLEEENVSFPLFEYTYVN